MHLLILELEVSRCLTQRPYFKAAGLRSLFNSITLSRDKRMFYRLCKLSTDSLKVANCKHCLLTDSFEEETYQSLVVYTFTSVYFYFDVI